jgi:hypothetical protein
MKFPVVFYIHLTLPGICFVTSISVYLIFKQDDRQIYTGMWPIQV